MSSVSSLPDRGKGVGPLALDFIERAALGAGIIALHLEVSGDDFELYLPRFRRSRTASRDEVLKRRRRVDGGRTNPRPWPNRHYCDARKARPFASCKMAILALTGLLSRFCLAISARGLILEAKAARPSVNAWS